MGHGKKNWYIVDGYLPYQGLCDSGQLVGHEAIMILNCNSHDAHILMDIYFEDKPPIKGIPISVGSERVKCIRMDHADEIGGVTLGRQVQYALRLSSDVDVIIQYGRMDLAQSNLAYIGLMGYQE